MRAILFCLPLLLQAQMEPRYAKADQFFTAHMERAKYPGLVYGIVVDGKLVHTKAFGTMDLDHPSPVTPQSVFRIASMTKSFTVLAILKLRDSGKLSLEDPITKFIPAAQGLKLPTSDSPAITVRHLLTHSEGFPEDNPWGDRQLAISEETLDAWLEKGFPFSTSPGTAYEYSNYGFALLGRIVARASGQPYKTYLETEILRPLGMNSSYLEPNDIPPTLHAKGYGTRNGQRFHIPSLGHGAFGAMGGLATSAEDLAKYVAFHLSAYPPRDAAESGPVKRSSVREMSQLQRLSGVRAGQSPFRASASGYGFGLGVSQDCVFGHVVGHGGGLPGFGSYMMWLPEYGVGMFAMANSTYASLAGTIRQALEQLSKDEVIRPRREPPSAAVMATADKLLSLWTQPDAAKLSALAADNLFQDYPAEMILQAIQDRKAKRTQCGGLTIVAENWLRGVVRLACKEGPIDITFTLAPTNPPLVQMLRFQERKETDPLPPAPRCAP
jgi:CubicO group peptidase (beta-lactamase class C family)